MPYYTEARDRPDGKWNRCWTTFRDLRAARVEKKDALKFFKQARIIHSKRDKTEEVVE